MNATRTLIFESDDLLHYDSAQWHANLTLLMSADVVLTIDKKNQYVYCN